MSQNLYFIGNSHLDQFRIKENLYKIKKDLKILKREI